MPKKYVPVSELSPDELEARRELERNKKREQYRKDPKGVAKRADVRSERAKLNRQQRVRAVKELFDANAIPEGHVRRPMRPRKRTIEPEPGVRLEVWMYTAGALAVALDRTTQSIRSWERQGVLPTSLYRDDRQRRLYTQDQVEAIVRVFADMRGERAFSWADSEVPEKLKRAWGALPHGVTPQKLETARRARR